jgi:hypothetical protein
VSRHAARAATVAAATAAERLVVFGAARNRAVQVQDQQTPTRRYDSTISDVTMGGTT